jgi:diguanylate cyclase (GGDEF)-like protein
MEIQDMSLILVVDDNAINLQIIAAIIDEMGYECSLAMSGADALEAMKLDVPDLILLDVMMPEMDGYEVCKIIKNNIDFNHIPIIFLTAMTESQAVLRGFEAGGVDYVVKPFNAAELKMRIRTHLELKKSKDQLNYLIAELQKTNEELKYASITDPLTGLHNRRYMMQKLEEEMTRSKRYKTNFSIIIGDIDLFKKINDNYGHDGGDFVLKEFSNLLKSCLREQDSLARWGGEEFLMLIPETDLDGAVILAERIRKIVESKPYYYRDYEIYFTITFGVASYNHEDSISDLIKRSDNGLYEGKKNGRNQVVAQI